MVNRAIQQRQFSRMWIIQNGSGPGNAPSYQGVWRAGAVAWAQGDITPIYVPDPQTYGRFSIAGKILGERGLPQLPLTAYYPSDRASLLLRLTRLTCDHDLQVHMGECRNPQDFNNGWEKVMVLERAHITNYGTTDLGALNPGEQESVMEEVPFTGEDLYEIVRMSFEEQAAAAIVQEIVDVIICDAVTCGQCGIPSDGCQVVLALTLSAGGSPGLSAEIIYTQDGGANYADTNITTLAANEDPNAMACVGINTVVISEDSDSLHYAPTADILSAGETWTEVTTGFVPTNGPLDIISLTARHTWIVAENGYIYFTEDPTASVSVQSAGSVTTEDLNAIHGIDTENLVAVGANNAVVRTADGGTTWALITGPNPATILNTVWMHSPTEWLVGDAGGQLWYTRDGGVTWTEKTFPGSGTGSVRDIKFATKAVGYMAHSTAALAGRILRTIDGGNSWYVMPEAAGFSIPANDYVAALAACTEEANLVYGGGLADNWTDGFLVKAAGPTS